MTYSARIQSFLRENARIYAEPLSVPPFTLFLHATDKSEMASFAMPDSPTGGDLHEPLRQIEEICATRGHTAHIRFLNAYAPELALALQACGYDEAEKMSVMVCTPESYRPAPHVPGLAMVTLSSESSLEEVKEGWNANALGYDLEATLATDEEADMFRQSLVGGRAFTARLNGQAVGAGMFSPITAKVTELAGITTLAPFRRRGIASYLTAFATQVAFAEGADVVFLIPENEQAHRIYERLGFNLLTSLLFYTNVPAR